ncbi:MAG: flagellar biosynthesis anti-sigma factor FlgM [Firmicutes bacterium]|jgi:flagellar biosynthesis anti-sigma factor FlgM|nr:flagellar biosynthesis anti-sigma factor FlgM [Bacillota bacterium]
MTIYSTGVRGVLRAYQGDRVTLNQDRRNVEGKAKSDEDSVVLSPQAQKLRRAQEMVAKESAVREEVVARISQEVAAGTYRIDPDEVAKKLLAASRLFDREV